MPQHYALEQHKSSHTLPVYSSSGRMIKSIGLNRLADGVEYPNEWTIPDLYRFAGEVVATVRQALRSASLYTVIFFNVQLKSLRSTIFYDYCRITGKSFKLVFHIIHSSDTLLVSGMGSYRKLFTVYVSIQVD